MEHLTAQDWKDLNTFYKDAYYFLFHRSLARERILLMSEHPDRLNEWQKRRLEELNDVNRNTGNSLDSLPIGREWKKKLTKAELKHIKETTKRGTKAEFLRNRAAKMKCFQCQDIARKLGLE